MSSTVSRDDLVGRMGGEEFAILLAGDGLPGALRLAEHLRTTTERRCVEPEGIRYTVSIGVAEHDPVDASDLAELIGRADRALYRAKGEGRNRSVPGPIMAG